MYKNFVILPSDYRDKISEAKLPTGEQLFSSADVSVAEGVRPGTFVSHKERLRDYIC